MVNALTLLSMMTFLVAAQVSKIFMLKVDRNRMYKLQEECTYKQDSNSIELKRRLIDDLRKNWSLMSREILVMTTLCFEMTQFLRRIMGGGHKDLFTQSLIMFCSCIAINFENINTNK
mmetsp:Transcript_90083/g.194928  ORF Transcript_90083/g.194928 Transcript_90083/m.194928 type:complete len:118 (+) Transcript_90083:375-728(+)